jgi:hypothetical protein
VDFLFGCVRAGGRAPELYIMVSGEFGTTGTIGTTSGAHLGRGIADGGGSAASLNVTAATVTPTDRVRWGPILAGLFAALSTLVVLSVLGAAVAGTAYDPGDRARTYGIGAGVWGLASMLLAFLIGGMVAARTAAVRGRHNGVLNGAMVWAVAIPLVIYLISTAIGAAGRTAGAVAQTGAVAANAAAQVDQSTVDKTIPESARQQADQAAGKVKGAIDDATQSPQAQPGAVAKRAADPVNQERAAYAVAWGAWSTLAALLLSLGAAAFGGFMGARATAHIPDVDTRAAVA